MNGGSIFQNIFQNLPFADYDEKQARLLRVLETSQALREKLRAHRRLALIETVRYAESGALALDYMLSNLAREDSPLQREATVLTQLAMPETAEGNLAEPNWEGLKVALRCVVRPDNADALVHPLEPARAAASYKEMFLQLFTKSHPIRTRAPAAKRQAIGQQIAACSTKEELNDKALVALGDAVSIPDELQRALIANALFTNRFDELLKPDHLDCRDDRSQLAFAGQAQEDVSDQPNPQNFLGMTDMATALAQSAMQAEAVAAAAEAAEEEEEEQPEECCICLGENPVDRQLNLAACPHKFCSSCITDWHAANQRGGMASCPVCRRDFRVDDIVELDQES